MILPSIITSIYGTRIIPLYTPGGPRGFLTAIVHGKRSHVIEHTLHKIIGIALFCITTSQVFGGLVRPDKDSKYRPFFN
jgi:formylmethanofuran:tetrahydromethanopterin formyltransferase